MIFTVGYRKADGSIGKANISDCDDHCSAREAVIEHLGVKTILVLIQGQK